MIACPKCMKWLTGARYAVSPTTCYECGEELPDSLRSTLDTERKAIAVQAEQSKRTVSGSAMQGWAMGLMFVSFVFLIIGFYQIYAKIGYGEKIVEGDAFNFIIYAERGLAFIGTGLTFAVLACALLLFEILNKREF
jgi:hypothetical protein